MGCNSALAFLALSFLTYSECSVFMKDGTIIRGQNEISHPTIGSMQLIDKGCCSALPSRIKRVFYMSSEGGDSLHEVSIRPYHIANLFTESRK